MMAASRTGDVVWGYVPPGVMVRECLRYGELQCFPRHPDRVHYGCLAAAACADAQRDHAS